MDWNLAIRRNREQLKDIVLGLFLLAGLRPGRSLPFSSALSRPLLMLPRSTIAAIMLVLRPAESAVRRLIVIAAHGLKLGSLAKPAAALTSPLWGEVPSGARRRGVYRAFALFDPLKPFDPDSLWDVKPVFESGYDLSKSVTWHDTATDHTPADATHLGHRLNAILRALNNLPRQARRLKRWELKRDAALKASKPTRLSPMRPGLPPGWRERKVHEIDPILKECHGLANDLLNAPDTS